MAKLHHSAIATRDVEASLVFWRDGLGFEVVMDQTFEGPWPELFGGESTTLRSLFLGEAASPESGIVELRRAQGAAAALWAVMETPGTILKELRTRPAKRPRGAE